MTKATKNTWTVLIFLTVVMVLAPLNVMAEGKNPYRTAYYVRAGETLDLICRNYGIDTELVAAMNNMDPNIRLSQGRMIYLPREPEVNYVLQAGDNLWNIAKKYRINVNYLISYNKLLNPDKLKIGQVVHIPAGSYEETESIRLAEEKPVLKVASRYLSGFFMPVIGVISSGYGSRKSGFHHGTDIAAETGTPIKAIKSGEVIFAGWRPIYGYCVTIDHGDEVESVYGHCSKLFVKKGQRVIGGQIIAKVGSTGRSTGPHLHLEIHVGDKTVNPMRYVQKI